MNQKWYEAAVVTNENDKFITGVWGKDLVDAEHVAFCKSLSIDCDVIITDEIGKNSMKSDIANNKYFIGIVDEILYKNEEMLKIEDLHNDNRLLIYNNFWLFANQNDVEEVIHNYELDTSVNVYEWFLQDPWSLYPNTVEGEIANDSFAKEFEVNILFADRINNLTKEEINNIDLEEIYVQCAKRVIVRNLKLEATRLEKEWGII